MVKSALTVCLAETWSKMLPTMNSFEIPDLCWLTVEERIQGPRETGTVTNLSFRTYSPTLGGSREHIFHRDLQKSA